MKKFIKSSAVLAAFALLTTGAFAAGKTDDNGTGKSAPKDVISFTSMDKDCGVGVMIHKEQPGVSSVTITDASGNVVLRDYLSKKDAFVSKGYDFDGMDEGDYTIAVNSNNEVVKKTVHVYSDENDQKLFMFAE